MDSSVDELFGKPPGRVIETPTTPVPPPKPTERYKPGPDDYALAGLAVGAVEFIADRVSPVPKMTEAQKRQGADVWAKAICANFPDIKAGPIVLALSALVWSVATIGSRAHGRKKSEPRASVDGDRRPAATDPDDSTDQERTGSDAPEGDQE